MAFRFSRRAITIASSAGHSTQLSDEDGLDAFAGGGASSIAQTRSDRQSVSTEVDVSRNNDDQDKKAHSAVRRASGKQHLASRIGVAGILAAALMFAVAACGGGYGGSTPSGPSNAPPAGALVINVVRENGNQSFSPNPATVPAGQTVVWHNVDTTTHRVVLDSGRLDSGDLAPNAFSQPMLLDAPGPYHCSIHPDMIGTLVNP
jgi:plastocyanin